MTMARLAISWSTTSAKSRSVEDVEARGLWPNVPRAASPRLSRPSLSCDRLEMSLTLSAEGPMSSVWSERTASPQSFSASRT